jgi:hypothetical protein
MTLTLTKATLGALLERADALGCHFAELSARHMAPELDPFAAALRKATPLTIAALRFDLVHRGVMALTPEGERVPPC